MRRCLICVLFVFCFLSILLQNAWSNEEGAEGILDPLCSPCKALSEKTLTTMTTKEGLTCLAFSTLFGTTCELLSGGNAAGAVLCTTSGVAVQGVCEYEYGGSPQRVKDDAHEASKKICKKVKLCK